jgi:hypothetical protein
MATLTPNQVLFVLRSVGTANRYTTPGKGYFNEDFMTSFFRDLHTPVGQLAAAMALDYELSYDFSGNVNGIIVLANPPTVDQIRIRVENIGMRIPNLYRSSPEQALTYYENFGYLYKFGRARTPNILDLTWPYGSSGGLLFSQMPLYKGNDFYLSIGLGIKLRDLFTDFDMFIVFPFLTQYADQLNSRPEIINFIIKASEPAGHFYEGYQTFPTGIRIEHTYAGQTKTYLNQEIKQMAHDGKLWFNDQPLPHIGLYQMAFKLKPEYIDNNAGIDVPITYKKIAYNLYQYFLRQIQIAEQRGEQKIRFSSIFSEFNADLNKGEEIGTMLVNLSNLTI